MFRLAVETGASLRIMNKQKLTPLTLAAKLAKKKVQQSFTHLFPLLCLHLSLPRCSGVRIFSSADCVLAETLKTNKKNIYVNLC